MTMMTFEEFQATRTECARLGSIGYSRGTPDDACANADGEGLVYLGDLVIERETAGHQHPIYTLLIGNEDIVSEELEPLERRLYQFALDEGYICDLSEDPNDCAECARSNGPWYTGPCEHSTPLFEREPPLFPRRCRLCGQDISDGKPCGCGFLAEKSPGELITPLGVHVRIEPPPPPGKPAGMKYIIPSYAPRVNYADALYALGDIHRAMCGVEWDAGVWAALGTILERVELRAAELDEPCPCGVCNPRPATLLPSFTLTDQNRRVWTPCAEGCVGWFLADVNREPDREIERCDECDRFANDDEARLHFVAMLQQHFSYPKDDAVADPFERLVTAMIEADRRELGLAIAAVEGEA